MTSSVRFTISSFRWIIPAKLEQDAQRGSGNWVLIHEQAARCVRLGIPVTFIAVMMKSNYLGLAERGAGGQALRVAVARQCLSSGAF